MNSMDSLINPGRDSTKALTGRLPRGEHGAVSNNSNNATPATSPAHARSMDAAAQIFNTQLSSASERSADAARYLTNGDSN